MTKIFQALTNWRNGVALLLGIGVCFWLAQDGPLPLESILIVAAASLALVYVVSALVGAITKSMRKSPPPAA